MTYSPGSRPGLIAALALIPAAMSASSVAWARGGPEELPPISPWHVSWEDKTCVLARAFGSKDNSVILRIERFGPHDSFGLILVGKRLRGTEAGDKVAIRYGVGGFVHEPGYILIGTTKDKIPSVFVTSTGLINNDDGDPEPRLQASPAQEAAVAEIGFERHGRGFVLKTGSLGPPFAALRKCTDDLVADWGLDPAQQNALRRRAAPTSDASTWLRSSDYPRGALMMGVQAIVNFRLSVSAEGKPTACEIQSAYADEEFKRRSCERLMKRASFAPALDALGNPVASFHLGTVKWIIPG